MGRLFDDFLDGCLRSSPMSTYGFPVMMGK